MDNASNRQSQPPRVPLARPWFDDAEARAAADVVATRYVIAGPRVREFEERFAAMLDVRHAIAVNSGSSALLVAMAALGVGPGDEIIVPDMTFVSTASAALFLGAAPVFADIDPRLHNLDPAQVDRWITPRTKLIVPVHYAGHACEMDRLAEVGQRHGVAILEDAAEAHLSRFGGRCAGTLGAAGIFSFTPSKPMTTGEGGMVVTDDADLAERCRLFRNFGDTDKFRWDSLGFNFRMPEVMGAIGLVQLAKLEESVARRRAIAARYTDAFDGQPALRPPQPTSSEAANFQLYTLRLDLDRLSIDRDEVIARLDAAGVSARLYYPPLHRQKVFERFGPFSDGDYPETLAFARTALSLPIFPELTGDQQSSVIRALLEIVEHAAV